MASNITSHSYNIVLDEITQQYIRNENSDILLYNIEGNKLEYISENIVYSVFGRGAQPENEKQEDPSFEEDPSVEEDNSFSRNSWTKTDIQQLINFYHTHESAFKSTTVKNDKVWQNIAKRLKTHDAIQCKNKFKYLKSKYIKKKDNMSSTSTGSKKIEFEYFDEMDEIFGQKPNVVPIAIASSSKQTIINKENKNEDCEEIFSDNGVTSSSKPTTILNKEKKPLKRSVLQKQLDLHQKNLDKNELAQERRHEENLAVKTQAVNVLKELLEQLKKSK